MRAFPLITETVETSRRQQVVDLTQLVRDHVRRAGLVDGIAVVLSPHTTAGVTVNENYDPDVKHDLLSKLEQMVPQSESYYQHDEGNSDAHVKTAMVGNSATLVVERAELVLGRWQGVFLCEFDGPRERRVLIKLLGEARGGARS